MHKNLVLVKLVYFFLVPRLKSSGFQPELSPNEDFSSRQF